MARKGIILAGGTGSRLRPLTLSLSKQLLPVYDKPMIYYPLSTLMLAGIRDILIITTARDLSAFQELLGDGHRWGISLSYKVQDKPEGIAQAFIIGEQFIAGEQVCLILGDNIFYAEGISRKLQAVANRQGGATIFGYQVLNPSDYGVVAFDSKGRAVSIEEKPSIAKSNYAVPGIYFYDEQVVEFSKTLKPSARGELEITDLNLAYLNLGRLSVELLSRGTAWLDTGQQSTLLDAANFVRIVEERQGLKIACPEEIAFRMSYIDANALCTLAEDYTASSGENDYARYLMRVADEGSKP